MIGEKIDSVRTEYTSLKQVTFNERRRNEPYHPYG